ncbi:DUF3581 family protein [Celerinatantimonas sp. YJH-8]|uniref:DUF3581 family protein n=1 Tax=Celerinatantimonas sp. YJH-8 TaxID=3228714 RepID=UPI0038C8292A
MFLDKYFEHCPEGVVISPDQASAFAKGICGDFNPIHDPEAKRFCVPGDLLFALVVTYYGLSQKMEFRFTGMVNDKTILNLPKDGQSEFAITDQQGKTLLEVSRGGPRSDDEKVIESVIRHYGAFSGQNFPTLLMPLMLKHQVMFNPARPLVMYDSMSFQLESLDLANLGVNLKETTLDVQGKRADEHLHFEFTDSGRIVGQGIKKAILGGLKPYDDGAIGAFAEDYEARRQALQASFL